MRDDGNNGRKKLAARARNSPGLGIDRYDQPPCCSSMPKLVPTTRDLPLRGGRHAGAPRPMPVTRLGHIRQSRPSRNATGDRSSRRRARRWRLRQGHEKRANWSPRCGAVSLRRHEWRARMAAPKRKTAPLGCRSARFWLLWLQLRVDVSECYRGNMDLWLPDQGSNLGPAD
jgi:hypothetical protein